MSGLSIVSPTPEEQSDTPTNTVDLAYRSLRRAILDGHLEPGTRLTEQGLAKQLGISRTPIREAIGRLVAEGFVQRGEGYSTRVAEFAPDEYAQVFEIRSRVEGYAARCAALSATEAEIAELRRLADIMTAHTPPKTDADYDTISRANGAFHKVIYAAARSPRLQVIMAAIVDVSVVARTYRTYSTRDLIRSAQHHQELVDAIAARAPDWAEHTMTAHVLAAMTSLQTAPGSPQEDRS